jgi:small nuclear ribonucleoprotein (snRNP)-like protein
MCIGTKRLTLSLALVASFLLSPAILAQNKATPSSDWSILNTVATGSELSVKLKDGKTVEGKLSSVSDAALSLSVKNKAVELKREDVESVYEIRRKSATKAVLIGLGIGAGAGALIGAVGDRSSNGGFEKIDTAVTAGLTVIGAGLGALTGYLIGRSGKKRVLIYEVRQP